jgi:hypothetical protein
MKILILILLITLFIIILLILHLLRINNLYSVDIQNKINNAHNKGFCVSLSLLPYFNTDNLDFNEYYQMIDYIVSKEPNKNIFKRDKISIKITHLAKNKETQWIILHDIVKYANKNNVFVWIPTVLLSNIEIEYQYYNKLKQLKYNNIGLTLATYHSNVGDKVDSILNRNGHIRLVKGYYYGDITDWNEVTNLYFVNAEKLIVSNNYHTLATHDFDLLLKLQSKYPEQENIELAFFYDAIHYVLQYIHLFPNQKSLYIPFGNPFIFLYHNIFLVNFKRIILHRLKYSWYYLTSTN